MKNLGKQVKRFEKQVKNKVVTIKRYYAQTILFYLVTRTPVDTSKALSNWIVGINKSKNRQIEAHSIGSRGSTEPYSSSVTMALGSAIIKRARVGEIVYITNNVDYIELLNMGYSSQAERHYIQHCVDQAVEQVKRMKI